MKAAETLWTTYLRNGLGRRLTMLGEKSGIHLLTYNPLVFLMFHDMGVRNAPGVAATFQAMFPGARRYADIGAGSGAYAAELRRRGVEVVACEHSRFGRWIARRSGVDSRPFDLTRDPPADLGAPADVAFCFEVAEHVPPGLGKRLVHFLAARAPIAIFSAAKPGQGGTGHINEQPKGYWIEVFERAGMCHDAAASEELRARFARNGVDATFLLENPMVFRRRIAL